MQQVIKYIKNYSVVKEVERECVYIKFTSTIRGNFSNSCSSQHIALNHYLYTERKYPKLFEDIDNSDRYHLEDTEDIDIGNDMIINISSVVSDSKEKPADRQVTLKLMSYVKTIDELREFVSKCRREYQEYISRKHKTKLYHFVVNGVSNRSIDYSVTEISDISSDKTTNFETFDYMFNEHKDRIIKDMDRLNDIEYFKQFGLKRKKGYLFYGEPGCGKTSTVMAIANKMHRHIIEIPIGRVKSDADFERIINYNGYHCVDVKGDNVIYLFDEMDCNMSLTRRDLEPKQNNTKVKRKKKSKKKKSKKRKNNKIEIGIDNEIEIRMDTDTESESESESETDTCNTIGYLDMTSGVSLGTMLSKLDGIGCYNGVIYIGTTNHIEQLDPALYRPGRLDPINFTFSRRKDIQDIIEKSYNVKLSDEKISQLPDSEHNISPATIKLHIQEHSDDVDKLIERLSQYVT